MKTNTKILIGIGIAAAATTAIAYGVYRELKAIRNLTITVDDLPDEDEAFEELVKKAEDLVKIKVDGRDLLPRQISVAYGGGHQGLQLLLLHCGILLV